MTDNRKKQEPKTKEIFFWILAVTIIGVAMFITFKN